MIQASIQVYSLDSCVNYFHWLKVNTCETTSIKCSFYFSTMSRVVSWTFSNFYKKWDTYNFAGNLHLYVCLWSWTYDGDPHSSQCHDLIVTWFLTHNIIHPCFLNQVLLFQIPIVMVFLVLPLHPLGFLLCVLLVHLNLHHILE